MQSSDSANDTMTKPGEQSGLNRHISPTVAHELNNVLTVVQCYSDCLLSQHKNDQSLLPHLKMISEASRRASAIVREAMPKNYNSFPNAPQPSL